MNLKTPKTFLIGCTAPNITAIVDYLRYTDQAEYIHEFQEGLNEHGPIALCSLYAKLCYKSLVVGKNANITKVRDTSSNIKGVFDSKHGSVFEHCQLNFLTTDCSRVFTHELVRHRVGTAFSQTSGRYVSLEDVDVVVPPDMEEAFQTNSRLALALSDYEWALARLIESLQQDLIPEGADFATKKRVTSAIRRFAPNGQTNEIGWSVNIRTLRHTVALRTSRHAEWEIRHVFNEVVKLVLDTCPLMLYGMEQEEVDGLNEYTFTC